VVVARFRGHWRHPVVFRLSAHDVFVPQPVDRLPQLVIQLLYVVIEYVVLPSPNSVYLDFMGAHGQESKS
jgi:hypothetical protein